MAHTSRSIEEVLLRASLRMPPPLHFLFLCVHISPGGPGPHGIPWWVVGNVERAQRHRLSHMESGYPTPGGLGRGTNGMGRGIWDGSHRGET